MAGEFLLGDRLGRPPRLVAEFFHRTRASLLAVPRILRFSGEMAQGFDTLSDDDLRKLAGDGAYGRGLAYHARGRVDLLSFDGSRAVARVRGSEDYRVDLRWRGRAPAGNCDCPAFDSTDFCKHMVALAITARERAREGGAVDRLERAADFLRKQGLEAAVTRLLSLVQRDPALLAEIESQAADATEGDDQLLRRYRKVIDGASHVEGFISYRGAGAYVEELSTVLNRLEGLIALGRATVVESLARHFLDAMEEIFEAIDDSDGEIGGVVARAGEIHLAACRSADVDPVELTQWLFEHEMSAEWFVFEGAAGTYADILGTAGAAEYRRLAAGAWAQSSRADRSNLYALRSMLDNFAREDGDLDARVALREADLSHPHAYLEIAQLYIDADRKAEALKWLHDGLWIFEDRPDRRLASLAASLEAEAGRLSQAMDVLWGFFQHQFDLTVIDELKGLSPDPAAIAERALAMLAAKGPPALLLDLQVAEGQLTEAWETTERHAIDERRLERLADLSRQAHPDRAIAVYERLIEGRVMLGNAVTYDAAVDLARRRGLICADPAAQAAYLSALALRHKAKRTFIQRLDALR